MSTTPQSSAEPAQSASPLDAHRSPVAETNKQSGKATAALVLGILGVLVALLVPIVGVILGVLAIVFGRQARADVQFNGAKSGGGLAKAGFLLGVIALVVAIVTMIIRIVVLTS